MKKINLLLVLIVIVIFASCGQSQSVIDTEKNEFQTINNKLGIIKKIDKTNKSFIFIMLPEKSEQRTKELDITFDDPILESNSAQNLTTDTLDENMSIRLFAISNGKTYDATKIVILAIPNKLELKSNYSLAIIDIKALEAIKAKLGKTLPDDFTTQKWINSGKASVAGKKDAFAFMLTCKTWKLVFSIDTIGNSLYNVTVQNNNKQIWSGIIEKDYKIK